MYVFLITTDVGPSQSTSQGEPKEPKKTPLTLAVDSPTEGAVNSHGSSCSVLVDSASCKIFCFAIQKHNNDNNI